MHNFAQECITTHEKYRTNRKNGGECEAKPSSGNKTPAPGPRPRPRRAERVCYPKELRSRHAHSKTKIVNAWPDASLSACSPRDDGGAYPPRYGGLPQGVPVHARGSPPYGGGYPPPSSRGEQADREASGQALTIFVFECEIGRASCRERV